MWVMRVRVIHRMDNSERDWYCHELVNYGIRPIILDLTGEGIDTDVDLTGKVFDIEYTSPYVSIAYGITEVTE